MGKAKVELGRRSFNPFNSFQDTESGGIGTILYLTGLGGLLLSRVVPREH